MQAAGLKLEARPDAPLWTPAREDLWRRIALHDFEPDTPLNFARRLARDHGWSLAFARAAVDAYRRFCCLAVLSPTPSETFARKGFCAEIKPIANEAKRRLKALGLAPTDVEVSAFRTTFLPLIGLVLAFGATKADIGAARGHPVGNLLGLMLATCVAAAFLMTRPTRTGAGSEALEAHRSAHAPAARASLDRELLLAVALNGSVVLSGTAYASIHEASKSRQRWGRRLRRRGGLRLGARPAPSQSAFRWRDETRRARRGSPRSRRGAAKSPAIRRP